MVLHSILKKLLNSSDMNISQLARKTKVPRQTLDNWLSGQEPRSLKQVKNVAEFFEVSVDYLCFGDKEKKEKIEDFSHEINAGAFEVVLRRIKKD